MGDGRLGHGLRGDGQRAVGLAGQGNREGALGAVERHGRAAEQARAGDHARDRRRRPGGTKRRGGPRRRRQSASVPRRRTRRPRWGLGAGRRGRCAATAATENRTSRQRFKGTWAIAFMRRAPRGIRLFRRLVRLAGEGEARSDRAPQRVHAIELLDVLGVVEVAVAVADDVAVDRVERGHRSDAGRAEGARRRAGRARSAARGWGACGPAAVRTSARPLPAPTARAHALHRRRRSALRPSPTLAPTSTAARISSSRWVVVSTATVTIAALTRRPRGRALPRAGRPARCATGRASSRTSRRRSRPAGDG